MKELIELLSERLSQHADVTHWRKVGGHIERADLATRLMKAMRDADIVVIHLDGGIPNKVRRDIWFEVGFTRSNSRYPLTIGSDVKSFARCFYIRNHQRIILPPDDSKGGNRARWDDFSDSFENLCSTILQRKQIRTLTKRLSQLVDADDVEFECEELRATVNRIAAKREGVRRLEEIVIGLEFEIANEALNWWGASQKRATAIAKRLKALRGPPDGDPVYSNIERISFRYQRRPVLICLVAMASTSVLLRLSFEPMRRLFDSRGQSIQPWIGPTAVAVVLGAVLVGSLLSSQNGVDQWVGSERRRGFLFACLVTAIALAYACIAGTNDNWNSVLAFTRNAGMPLVAYVLVRDLLVRSRLFVWSAVRSIVKWLPLLVAIDAVTRLLHIAPDPVQWSFEPLRIAALDVAWKLVPNITIIGASLLVMFLAPTVLCWAIAVAIGAFKLERPAK